QAALAGSFVYGLFDGVFYHMIVFMPVAMIAGFAIGQRHTTDPSRHTIHQQVVGGGLVVMSIVVLLLHNWLFFALLKDQTVKPDSLAPRILRAFPSTTHGLPNWIELWRSTQPDVAMEWIN